jgi:hypothetical protein
MEWLCAAHGGFSHIFVHKAARVVAALERNIRLSEVKLLSPEDWIAAHDGVMAGGVLTVANARSLGPGGPGSRNGVRARWRGRSDRIVRTLPRPGVHGRSQCVPYRRRANRRRTDTPAGIVEILGEPLNKTVRRIEHWSVVNWLAIKAVTRRLGCVDADATLGWLDFDESCRVTEDEVVAVVALAVTP